MATVAPPQKKKFDAGLAQAERVIELISQVDKWEKPWFANGLPFNPITKHTYRGSNTFYLQLMNMVYGYSDNRWVTFKQITENGGNLNKGAKSAMILFFKPIIKPSKDDPTKDEVVGIATRYYNVFNVEETTGLNLPEIEKPYIDFTPVEAAEDIVNNYNGRPSILHGSYLACYRPLTHEVKMPNRDVFKSIEDYYATLFHELTHSTGHKSLIGRLDSVDSTDKMDSYAKEELVAELGATMLCGITGITGTESNNAAYLKSWFGKLKNDPMLLIRASRDAQKAIDYILGTQFAEN